MIFQAERNSELKDQPNTVATGSQDQRVINQEVDAIDLLNEEYSSINFYSSCAILNCVLETFF